MNVNKYPEHLNPFAEESKRKTTLKLSNSFREFTKTLRKSFRIKKKNDQDDNDTVEIRNRSQNFQRLPISYPNGIESLTPALPRSRFQERLTKSRTFNPAITSTPTSHTFNPFEESDDIDGSGGGDKRPIKPPIRRRGKRRAPLPPKSISSQNVNNLNLQHSSHWSLTSADTDITGSTENFSEIGYNTDGDRLSITENFVDFNKEMVKLNEHTNNGNINTKDNDNIPDLVVTCPNDDDDDDHKSQISDRIHQNNNDNNEIKHESDNEEIIVKDITENLQNPESHEVQIEAQNQIEAVQNENSNENNANSIVEDRNDTKEISIDENSSKIDDSIVNDESIINTKELPTDNNNSINDIEKLSIKGDDSTTNQPFLYHENRSLYITGSRDDLDTENIYTGRYSLYIEGSKENLDECNNNNNNNDNNDSNNEVNENNNEPVPKQRKNKLTKTLLLGTAQ